MSKTKPSMNDVRQAAHIYSLGQQADPCMLTRRDLRIAFQEGAKWYEAKQAKLAAAIPKTTP